MKKIICSLLMAVNISSNLHTEKKLKTSPLLRLQPEFIIGRTPQKLHSKFHTT